MYWADLAMLLPCKEMNRDLVRESFAVDIRTPTCVHSPRRQSVFLLSLFCIFGSNTVGLHFIFAVCVMKCKHFSRDRKTGCHGIISLFKNNFYTLPEVSENKSYLLLYPWSKHASIRSFLFLPGNARKYLPVFFQSCMWMKYMPTH